MGVIMVIHHDKMAYGKIKPLKDEIDESRLAAMAKKLSSIKEEEPPVKERTPAPTPKQNGVDGKN